MENEDGELEFFKIIWFVSKKGINKIIRLIKDNVSGLKISLEAKDAIYENKINIPPKNTKIKIYPSQKDSFRRFDADAVQTVCIMIAIIIDTGFSNWVITAKMRAAKTINEIYEISRIKIQ